MIINVEDDHFQKIAKWHAQLTEQHGTILMLEAEVARLRAEVDRLEEENRKLRSWPYDRTL